jgi:ribosomal protein S18 acetylase RimI-like enzyme
MGTITMIKKSDIKIKLIKNEELKKIKFQLKCLLLEIDSDFIPTLSSRQSTTQTKLCHNNGTKNIDFYFNNIINQNIITAQIDEKILGFISYIDNYIAIELPIENSHYDYITTIGVSPEFRGYKIATELYKYMISKAHCNLYSYQTIVTRTWSSNLSHINLLHKLNFKEIKRIANHRGNNIDTVYYAYSRNKL